MSLYMEEKVALVKKKLSIWEPLLIDPLWYKQVMPELIELWSGEYTKEEKNVLWELVYGFFEERLSSGRIAIVETGPDFDQWRKPIDSIIIHHTGNGKGGVSWKRLSTIGFLRQYAQDYDRYDDVYGIPTKGSPIWSNHLREEDGKVIPVFYAYHWIVRKDGSFERLLQDSDIGWQAGNSAFNYSGIAIVLDGEFIESVPPQEMLNGVKEIIETFYNSVDKSRIFGHREVNPKTICPGNLFLSDWKEMIV